RPVTLNVFATLAHDRGLFYRWLAFAARLMPYGKLPRADTERVILRVGYRTGSWYEWVQHVRIAQVAGLSADEIDDLQLDNAPGWTDRTRALMLATDELIRQHHLGDDGWRRLRTHLNDKQCLEFCMLVGHYAMLAMTLNTLGVAVEPAYEIPLVPR
ncbi:carboxymuconolactone decarboxylase family protein, partial [Aquabacterium sp.]|uniref:carboxymuconolactone decarboxylase family protein n=1 Tax=Aquabacterium sp. TaxID=1872578 RepID=UPI0035AEA75C